MFKMKTISILAIAGLVLALAPAAQAETITFTPDDVSADVGILDSAYPACKQAPGGFVFQVC